VTMPRLKIATLLLGMAFLALMGIRQFKYGGWRWASPGFTLSEQASLGDRDTWMHILQKGGKVGHAHSFRRTSAKGYTIGEEVYMRLTALGTLQEVQMTTRANLAADYSLMDFEFVLASGGFRFQSQGRVAGRTLMVEIKTPESERALSIPLSAPLHLPAGILDAALAAQLPPGESLALALFDPATLGNAPATITNKGPETIIIAGREHLTRHYTIVFKGATQHAWMDDRGNLWRQEGLLGLVLEQTTREAALGMDVATAAGDIIQDVAIPAGHNLADPASLPDLAVEISGIDTPAEILHGGRQQYAGGRLTIIKERIPEAASRKRPRGTARTHGEFLQSTPFIQADHPRIKAVVARVTARHDPALIKVQKLMAWIAEHIKQRPVLSLPSALSVLEQGVGDCNEHAVLLAALGRAAGIPAQVEAGLVYQNGRFYYHAWNRIFLGEWITADAIFNQLPADVTHIRLARGADNLYFDLMGMIGKVRVSIVPPTD